MIVDEPLLLAASLGLIFLSFLLILLINGKAAKKSPWLLHPAKDDLHIKTVFWKLPNRRILTQRGDEFLYLPISEHDLLVNNAELARDIAQKFHLNPSKVSRGKLKGAVAIYIDLLPKTYFTAQSSAFSD